MFWWPPPAVADLKGARGTPAPLGVQILSISCSFWENLAKLFVGPPGLAPPPRGNPASATNQVSVSVGRGRYPRSYGNPLPRHTHVTLDIPPQPWTYPSPLDILHTHPPQLVTLDMFPVMTTGPALYTE